MANIVITGTSRGIGFELVKLFAQEGSTMVGELDVSWLSRCALISCTAWPEILDLDHRIVKPARER